MGFEKALDCLVALLQELAAARKAESGEAAEMAEMIEVVEMTEAAKTESKKLPVGVEGV